MFNSHCLSIMLYISEASNSSEKNVNTKYFSFKMKKRKELLILVFLASFCIHIILFLLNANPVVATHRGNRD